MTWRAAWKEKRFREQAIGRQALEVQQHAARFRRKFSSDEAALAVADRRGLNEPRYYEIARIIRLDMEFEGKARGR